MIGRILAFGVALLATSVAHAQEDVAAFYKGKQIRIIVGSSAANKIYGGGGGDVHRRLVGFERDERILGGDSVAGGDQELDHGDLAEVPDVGDADFETGRSRRHTVVGNGAAGSIS